MKTLTDWTPIQTPDGLWCVWSERTQLPIRMGSKQAALLPDVSKALGSIDRAQDAFRAAHADPDRWDRLLASLPPATARFLASKVGEPVERPALAPLRQMPASSASNPYTTGDQPKVEPVRVKAAPAPVADMVFRYDEAIRALHSEGLYTTEIARRAGCSTHAVRDGMARMGLKAHRKEREPYTHPADDKIRALFAEGLHDSEIARRAGVSVRVGSARIKALGLVAAKDDAGRWERLPQNTAQHDDAIAKLHADGLTIAQIADVVGCARETARTGLKRRGLKAHKPVDPAQVQRDAQHLELHARGLGNAEIARHMGITPASVRERNERMGLRANPRREDAP